MGDLTDLEGWEGTDFLGRHGLSLRSVKAFPCQGYEEEFGKENPL